MALRVAQVDRTTNSITINVSGITEGSRRTSVWMPSGMLNSSSGKWYTLYDAKDNGYISDFYVVDYATANGDITITVSNKYLNKGYRVVDVKVENIDTAAGDKDIWLSTILDFEYENSFPKKSGSEIDITVDDMKELNLFGLYIDYWINGGDGIYHPLETAQSGDEIEAVYLWQPAKNILDTAINCNNLGTNYDKVWGYISGIVNKCVSGADFKALWFNDIVYAIRNFNLSYTV